MNVTEQVRLYQQFRIFLNKHKSYCFSSIYKSTIPLFINLLITFIACSSPNQIGTGQNENESATDDYVTPITAYETNDKIYRDNIKSVQLHPKDAPVSPPYVELGTGTSLLLSFDDLDADFKTYTYTIVHCTANWLESDLFESDFIEGFLEMNISDFNSSFNTAVPYTHYEVEFPSLDMAPRLSGNYILYVFEDNDRERPVLTRRFVVYEQLVRFRSRVKESSTISERRFMQEVDFDIVHPNYPIQNPYSDLNVAILQNNRWDNAITDLQPMYVKNNELTYDYNEENNFNGVNEFRHFDLKSLRYATNEVAAITENSDGVPQIVLVPDEKRTFTTYRNDQDIDGFYLVRNDDAYDDGTESQYVNVFFSVPMEQPFIGRNVYIFGELSLWNMSKDFRMTYNTATKQYEAMVLLKQGYYNYMYMVEEPGRKNGDLTVLEGNHSETDNEFTIFVYHYDISQGYYRVVGALFTDTFNR